MAKSNENLHSKKRGRAEKIRRSALCFCEKWVPVKPLQEFWYMEVLSSTEWSVNSSMNKFNPNLFVEIGKDGVEKKIETLKAYRGVIT